MRWVSLLLAIFLGLTTVGQAVAKQNVALVIGNNSYVHRPRLKNSERDAQSVGTALQNKGFMLVGGGPLVDLDKVTTEVMVKTLVAFANANAKYSDVALFYFSGYGMQVGGRNFLLPIDVRSPADAKTVELQALDVDLLVKAISTSRARLKIILLDTKGPGGLAPMQAPANTIIGFAAQPNAPAAQGPSGGISPYANALAIYLSHLPMPEFLPRPMESFEALFQRFAVMIATKQKPFLTYSEPRCVTFPQNYNPEAGLQYLLSHPGTRVCPSPHPDPAGQAEILQQGAERAIIANELLRCSMSGRGCLEAQGKAAAERPQVEEEVRRQVAAMEAAVRAEEERDAKAAAERRLREAESQSAKAAAVRAEEESKAKAAAEPPQAEEEARRKAAEAERSQKTSAEASLPQFPWPPPRASASWVLPEKLLESHITVGSVAGAIMSALERNGYVERSFFKTKEDGVVLVTRLERINSDGSSADGSKRWAAATPITTSADETMNLFEFLRGLFFIPPGRYRIIAFVLQERPFTQSPRQIAEDEASAWLLKGGNVLPDEIAARPVGKAHCSVLIYEFASNGIRRARLVDSPLTGKEHLTKAGVLEVLGKGN